MTSHASVETAVQAIRQGAYDYLQKPFEDVEDVWITVRRAFEKRDLLLRNRALLLEAEVRNRELASAVMRLTSLTEAGRAMGHCQSLPELLDFVLGLVTRELDVDRASLMLIEEGTEHLRIVACRGMDSIETDKVRVRLGEGIAGSVAMTGTPFLVTDMTHDPRIAKPLNPGLSDSFISTPIVLSMPIKSREAILGVINVTNRRSGGPFTPEDLSYLTGLAGQLAVAVEGTRHFSNLKKAYESLKSAQERIVRSERLKAIGEMAAGVAHDFNNALSVLMGKAQTVQNKLAAQPIDLESIRADLETMRKVSEQAAGTIRRIQDYTRIRKDVSSAPVNLDVVVRDAVEITRHKWKTEAGSRSRPIELVLELHELPPVSGNAQELAQAVGNLIFNAVEAMPDGGTLTLRTFAEGDRVVLEVEDTGIGMPPEVQEHLFEPFFTTKENGQGLGASIIYGIISRHHGDIRVHSAAGKGTTFQIRLPQGVLETSAPATAEPGLLAPGRTGGRPPRRVLLVEDERLVRETFAEVLAACGHGVAPASAPEKRRSPPSSSARSKSSSRISPCRACRVSSSQGRSGRAGWTFPSFC